MNITRRTAAIGGLSVLAGNAISKTARAEFGEGLRDIGEGLESGLPGQIGMASRSVARNFLSRLTYHSRLMASRRVLQRSEWSKIHCRPRVDLAPSPALCCWSSPLYVGRPANIGSTVIFASASQHINEKEHFVFWQRPNQDGAVVRQPSATSVFLYCIKIDEKESSSFATGFSWRSGWAARVIFRRPFARASAGDDCGVSRDRSNSVAPALPPSDVRSSFSQVAAIANPIEARWARR